MIHTERFAPSPTGRLHLGHAFSALLAHDRARAAEGRFLLRMEDLDQGRVRATFDTGILDDLAWLGLTLDGPVLRQSTRRAAYGAALARLEAMGLTYACTCSRKDIEAAIAAPHGPGGQVYPGTCRGRTVDRADAAIRLDLGRALAMADTPIRYFETGIGAAEIVADPARMIAGLGDVVLRRRDGAHAYHLAVVVDDAHQGVTHVTRGVDLADVTPLHALLQMLLGLEAPVYHHHRLILDDGGKRLAKRHDALSLAALREGGVAPVEIRERLHLTD